ncbi:hypothetical protein AVEN_208193-1, partial [Araneus ventricosus]
IHLKNLEYEFTSESEEEDGESESLNDFQPLLGKLVICQVSSTASVNLTIGAVQ